METKPFHFVYLLLLIANIQVNFAEGVRQDVLLLIDGSGSVKPANFDNLRVFLKAIVDRLDDETNVALIQFSSRQLTKVEFNLDTYQNKDDVKKAIDEMVYQRKYTYTGHAMRMARNQVFNGRGGDRPDAENVLLLFTDGEAADPHIARAQSTQMKSKGTHVMSIGFGPEESVKKFKDELVAVASSADKDVFVKGFKDLENINQRLQEVAEPENKGQSVDQCSTRPCKNGGICVSYEDGYKCTCTENYEGRNCEKTKGPCHKKPCLNGGACIELDMYDEGFICLCDDKYYGDLCEKKKVVCKAKIADLIFILDGSRSIKTSDFEKMKEFVIELVNRFNISQYETHVGIVQFSVGVRTEFDLYKYPNKKSLLSAIKRIRLQDGDATYTDEAFAHVRTEVFKHSRGDRDDVRNVIILLTDGYAHEPDRTAEEASKLKDDDVSIITIGVGKGEVEESLQDFLRKLASSPKYMFKANFETLESIQNGVIKAACENLRNI